MPCYWNLPAGCGEISDYGESRDSTEVFCATWCCPCYWCCCLFTYCFVDGTYIVLRICEKLFHGINDKLGRSYETNEYKKRQKNAPRPLPSRKRRLTPPIQERPKFSLPRKPQKTFDQDQSPLFKLPAELRAMIWKEVMSGKVFHIGLKKKRVQHTLCAVCKATDYCTGPAVTCWPFYDYSDTYPVSSAPQKSGVLALAKTCRRIYSETIDLVYSTNTFSFNELDCIRWFALTTLRMDVIQSLRVYWDLDHTVHGIRISHGADWQSFCHIIVGMKGLKDLRIKLHGSARRWQNFNLLPLEPLMGLGGLEVFQIYVPRIRCPSHEQGRPFQLIDVREWPQQ